MKPMKIKIFTYFTTNINPPNEMQINEWLEKKQGIEIENITQSESMVVKEGEIERNMSITMLYREQ